MYINLIDKLTELDKKRIENYVLAYGATEGFVGVDKWLQDWSHANQKLYKLLGGQLIVKKELKLAKNKEILLEQFKWLFFDTDFFDTLKDFKSFYCAVRADEFDVHIFDYLTKKEDNFLKSGMFNVINFLTENSDKAVDVFINDAIETGFKIVAPYSGKTFQVQKGMKPVRALKKIVDFFKAEASANPDYAKRVALQLKRVDNEYEQFRVKASMIFNDKFITGKLCISIHPLDYITMSDNSLDWSSCMSWTSEGCYRVGTIEMMNSNNTLCCYVEGENPFCFKKELHILQNNFSEYGKTEEEIAKIKQEIKEIRETASEDYLWNNKKWRVLAYINKDIVMTGKSYPYYNEDLDKKLLSFLVELAGSNMSWQYEFGPELYQDMKHIHSKYTLEVNRDWIRYGGAKKHNIIWDTRGMYNDMLNANTYQYWCYRNKVNHNKIYSVSGKATCLCCCKSIISESDYDDYDYNERFNNAGATVCEDCSVIYGGCDICESVNNNEKHYKIIINGKECKVCERCFDSLAVKCPCCGKPMWVIPADFYEYRDIQRLPIYIPGEDQLYHFPIMPQSGSWRRWQNSYLINDRAKDDEQHPLLEYLFMCEDCLKLRSSKLIKETRSVYRGWSLDKKKQKFFTFTNLDVPVDKLCYRGLEHIDPADAVSQTLVFKPVGMVPEAD